jgi:hypothetical protein
MRGCILGGKTKKVHKPIRRRKKDIDGSAHPHLNSTLSIFKYLSHLIFILILTIYLIKNFNFFNKTMIKISVKIKNDKYLKIEY